MFCRATLLSALVAFVSTQTCSPGPVDVMFVIGSDDSVDSTSFYQMIDVILDYVQAVNIGSDDVRVGLITEHDNPELLFDMQTHLYKDEMMLAVRFAYFKRGDPNFGSGLKYIREHGMDSGLGGRPGVPDVVILLTSSLPSNTAFAQEEAKHLSDSGVTVIAVGVGVTDNSSLVTLASGPHYATLAPLVSHPATPIVQLTCEAVNPASFVDRLGCDPAEVVFMIEYGIGTDETDIEYEGKFIVELIKNWKLSDQDVRVAIVVYKDRAIELIHLDDFPNDEAGLIARIGQLTTGSLRPSGNPDLTLALDYVRTHSFTNARPNVPQVVIPIVHKMNCNVTNYSQIPSAGQRLKDEGVHVFGHTVDDRSLKEDVIRQMVTDPSGYYYNYPSFQALDNAARYFYSQPNC